MAVGEARAPADASRARPARGERGERVDRRGFLRACGRAVTGLLLAAVSGLSLLRRGRGAPPAAGAGEGWRWQIDPEKCIQCGQCATACVLTPSAVKCVHAYAVCGYCRLCGGYHRPEVKHLDTAAESQLCPTGAIKRTFIEDPYYEYTIDEDLCIGCARCVHGCSVFGNGSLFLQVRHDRCVNCNECAIARVCPAGAFRRVPARAPYLLRG